MNAFRLDLYIDIHVHGQKVVNILLEMGKTTYLRRLNKNLLNLILNLGVIFYPSTRSAEGKHCYMCTLINPFITINNPFITIIN